MYLTTAGPLAGAEGFEPPNAGTKNQCLTTWRRPNILDDSRTRERAAKSVKNRVILAKFGFFSHQQLELVCKMNYYRRYWVEEEA